MAQLPGKVHLSETASAPAATPLQDHLHAAVRTALDPHNPAAERLIAGLGGSEEVRTKIATYLRSVLGAVPVAARSQAREEIGHLLGAWPEGLDAYADVAGIALAELLRLSAGTYWPRTRRLAEDAGALAALMIADQEALGLITVEKSAAHVVSREIHLLAETFDKEVQAAFSELAERNDKIGEATEAMRRAADAVIEQTRLVENSSREAALNVEAVAAATDNVAAANREIGAKVAESARVAETAVEEVDAARTCILSLDEAARKIADVVALIAEIAAQTNLLALNATIEAARAGEAGKGFAVVASEVKTLAGQTAKATEEIGDQARAIQAATTQAVGAIQSIARVVQAIDDIAAAASADVEQQISTTGQISGNAREASHRTQAVTAAVESLNSEAQRSGQLARTVGSEAGSSRRATDDLRHRLAIILRGNSSGNRRRFQRYPVNAPTSLSVHGNPLMTGAAQDISRGGAFVRIEDGDVAAQLAPGTIIEAHIGRLPPLPVGVMEHNNGVVRLQFGVLDNTQTEPLVDYLHDLEHADQPYIELIQKTAQRIQGVFENAIKAREITVDHLFDEAYRLIPNSNPSQYMTRFTELCDRLLPPIQEPVTEFGGIFFAVTVDRNGYLPTHNKAYSQPQGADPVWNAAHCRNRRMFNDRTGLAAAVNTDPFLLQTYYRDMGGGRTVFMKDLSAPIMIDGRHWGSFRAGYRVT